MNDRNTEESAAPGGSHNHMTGPIDLAKLAEVVAQMRHLGVTKFGDIELGPDPNIRPDEEAATQRTAEAQHLKRQRDERVRFGASGGPRPRVTP